MRQSFLLLSFILVLIKPFFAQKTFPFNARPDEKIMLISMHGNIPCLLTDHRILELEKEKWVEKWSSTEPLTAAQVLGDTYWVGTQKGLMRVSSSTWEVQPISDLKAVAAISLNKQRTGVLVSSYLSGVYEFKGLEPKKIATNFDVNAVCDCGNYRWFGTNAGLIRNDGQQTDTYTEEGVKGLEIPDNVVDALFCPLSNDLVVIMPEGIAFLTMPNGVAENHPEHFDFIGEASNEIYDVVQLSNADFLFLTKTGLLHLSKSKIAAHDEEAGFHEAHSAENHAQVYRLDLGQGNWLKCSTDAKGNIWLASSKEVIKITSKKLLKMAQQYERVD